MNQILSPVSSHWRASQLVRSAVLLQTRPRTFCVTSEMQESRVDCIFSGSIFFISTSSDNCSLNADSSAARFFSGDTSVVLTELFASDAGAAG